MKLWAAALLWLGLMTLMVANSADFFFHRPFWEWWDTGANALSVERAKDFEQLYGAYSRWGFCHPGPSLFYLQAFGQWLFYDRLHVAPAPFNAQTLFHLGVMMACFVAALRVFSQWLPRRAWALFLPLAIAVSALHFTAIARIPAYDILRGPTAFAGVWPVHVVVLPFACMLIAGASVAAGRGRDLPLLFLCAGFLLQLHVNEPLFVFPVAVLSWCGLIVTSAWRAGKQNPGARWTWKLGAAWRDYRRAHLLSLGIVFLTALPVLIDLHWGADSNLAAILDHMRNHRGEHKSWRRSAMYFLQFGAYAPYKPGDMEFGSFDHAGAMAYLRAHAAFYAVWIAGIVTGLVAAFQRPRVTVDPVAADMPVEEQGPSGPFFVRFGGLIVLVIFLTLFWGTIQDGHMYYYNAWLNFGIYGAGAWVIVAAASLLVARRFGFGAARARWPQVAAWAAAAAVCVALGGPLRIADANPTVNAAMHAGIMHALATLAPPGSPRMARVLKYPDDFWDDGDAVVLQLERSGEQVVIPDRWRMVFTAKHIWSNLARQRPHPQMQVWTITPTFDPNAGPLGITFQHDKETAHAVVTVTYPVLDPAGVAGPADISFKYGGGADRFMIGGFGEAEKDARWTDSTYAVLAFKPMPCGEKGVRLTMEAGPIINPAAGVDHQRLRLLFNGQPLGEERRLTGKEGPLVWDIPAALWNDAAAETGPEAHAILEMELPDAIAPHTLDRKTPDRRTLGMDMVAMHFTAVP